MNNKLLLIFGISFFLIGIVSAANSLFINNISTDTYIGINENANRNDLGQTFFYNSNFDVTNITVLLFKIGNPLENISAYIYSTDGTGKPLAKLYTSTSLVNASSVPVSAAGTLYNFSFNTISLTNDVIYAVVLNASYGENQGGDHIRWKMSSSGGGYPSGSTGNMSWQENSGQTWVQESSSYIYWYRVYGNYPGLSVSLNSPSNSSEHMNPVNFSAIINSADQLSNSTLIIYNLSKSIVYREFKTISGLLSTPSWIINNFSYGNYSYNVVACDVVTCLASASNFSFIIKTAIVNNVSYNNPVFESSLEAFTLNLSYDSLVYNSISANLVYNGTKYTSTKSGTNNKAIFSRSITIPSVNITQNLSFYWEVILGTGSSLDYLNSSVYNQTVKPIIFTYCNGTYGTAAVNFTIYDEENTTLPVISTFDVTFNYLLSTTGTAKTATFNLSGLSNYTFCASPNLTFFVSSTIKLTAPGYSTRNFNFNKAGYFANNVTTIQPLYLIPSGLDSNINIEVKSPGLQALKEWYVKIYRYYPSTNSFVLIENQKTDNYGRIVSQLIENTVDYKFEFYNNSNTLKKTANNVKIICPAVYCVLQFIIEDTTNYFTRFKNVSNYDSTLAFNNNTNIFSFTWNDNTGDSPTHRLFVRRFLLNGSITVCDNSSAGTSGILTCHIGSQKASYVAQAYRSVSGTENLISTLNAKVGDLSATFKKEGLFWSFILLLTLISIGSFHPPTGIFLYLAGFVALGYLEIITFNAPIFIGMLVIGIIFMWAFKS